MRPDNDAQLSPIKAFLLSWAKWELVIRKQVFHLFLSSLLVLLFSIISFAQNDVEEPRKYNISGYIKSMHGLYHISEPSLRFDTTLIDAFVHNRINFEWFPNDKFTLKAEMRNRLFYGQLSNSPLFPGFKEGLKTGGNDVLNLQLLNVGENIILHSIFDRFYADYTTGNWEIRLGRQRVNWGINTVWNPHDIFNAYSFTDFDYEERPGSDALRVKYYTGFAGSIEFALKAFNDKDEIVAGFLWKTNKNNYDYQFLLGWANNDLVLGAGWAGAIKEVGFKGEASYFMNTDGRSSNAFAATVSVDYAFPNGTFIASGLLYNNQGSSSQRNGNIFSFELSAKNLYPFEYSFFNAINLPFTPLLSAGLSVIYSPVQTHLLFLNPTLTYSVSQNVDLDLIGQLIFQKGNEKYRSPTQVIYLRAKWSW